MLKVKQVFDDSGQRYGAEKIWVVLADSGIRVSKKRITTIMQELGLYSIRVDAKKQFKKKQQYAKQNLLKREFSADHPNQIWVSDITYFKVKSYWAYLCVSAWGKNDRGPLQYSRLHPGNNSLYY